MGEGADGTRYGEASVCVDALVGGSGGGWCGAGDGYGASYGSEYC